MRTLYVLVAVVLGWVAGSLLRVDSDAKLMFVITAFLLGLAVARPRWLRLKWPVQEAESDRETAAVFAGIAAIVFGALLCWQLAGIHQSRQRCSAALASSMPGRHGPILIHTVTLPLGDVVTCSS